MYVLYLILAIFAGIMIGTFVLPKIVPFGSWINSVEGRSMEPTLRDRQWMFSDRFGEIERGDIVTAWMPESEDVSIVKRVIGVPGDKISIYDNQVFLNDQLLDETYLTQEAKQENSYEGIIYADVLLSDDEYYLMGDNRGNSNDSRNFGPVKEEDIIYEQSVSITKSFVLDSGKAIILVLAFVGIAMGLEKLFTARKYD